MNTESTTPQAATTAHRYAVYFAPSPGTLGWLAGSHWRGRCAAQLRPLPQLNIHGVAPADLQRLTAAPRRHGWHATLKAPFALAPGTDWLTLHHAVQQVARSLTPFTMPPMQVQRINDFLVEDEANGQVTPRPGLAFEHDGRLRMTDANIVAVDYDASATRVTSAMAENPAMVATAHEPTSRIENTMAVMTAIPTDVPMRCPVCIMAPELPA